MSSLSPPSPLSLLDRLEPEGASPRRTSTERVRRDLDELLNTRRPWIHPPQGRSSIPDDILFLGLPDISELSVEFQLDPGRVVSLLQSALKQFDPRLASVRVSMEGDPSRSGAIRFRVRSLLKIAGEAESLDIDARLEAGSQRFAVALHHAGRSA